jgi:transposase
MKRISQEKIKDVRDLDKKGLTTRQIEAITGVNKSSVSRILRKKTKNTKKNLGGRPRLLSERKIKYVIGKFEKR